MLIRTDIFLVWVSLFSQHQEQCLALGMKEKRKGEVKRGERDRHRSLSLQSLRSSRDLLCIYLFTDTLSLEGRECLSFACVFRPIIQNHIKATGDAQELWVGLNHMLNKYALVVIVTLVVVAAVSSRKAPLPATLSRRWYWCCWGVASPPGLLSPAGKSASLTCLPLWLPA